MNGKPLEYCCLSKRVGVPIFVDRRVDALGRIIRLTRGDNVEFMSITVKEIEGIPLLMPKFLSDKWPNHTLISEFPNFCGAGEGFGEALVPETFYGLSMRHVCFIHDVTHTIFDPTRDFWHLSNQIMLVNALNTIRARTDFWMLRMLRNRRAILYYDGVESRTGLKAFLDRPGGNQGQENYEPEKDPTVISKLKLVGVYL